MILNDYGKLYFLLLCYQIYEGWQRLKNNLCPKWDGLRVSQALLCLIQALYPDYFKKGKAFLRQIQHSDFFLEHYWVFAFVFVTIWNYAM